MSAGTGELLLRAADAAIERERMYAARKRVNKVALALSLAGCVVLSAVAVLGALAVA